MGAIKIIFVVVLGLLGSLRAELCDKTIKRLTEGSEALRLNDRDRILGTEFARQVFRVSRSAAEVARKLNISEDVSDEDRYFDFFNELRERHAFMARYVSWLHELDHKYRRPGNDRALANLAEVLRPQFFDVDIPLNRPKAVRITPIEKINEKEFQARYDIAFSMAQRALNAYTTANSRFEDRKPVTDEEVLLVYELRRRSMANILKLASVTEPKFEKIKSLQKIVKDKLSFEFSDDFTYVSTNSIDVDTDLTAERAANPRVIQARDVFMTLKALPPKEDEFWDQLIENLWED